MSISNLIKKNAPAVAKTVGTAVPAIGVPASVISGLLKNRANQSVVPTQSIAPKMATSVAPAPQTPVQATTAAPRPQYTAPATQSAPQKGLVSTNPATLESLRSGLLNAQSGLDALKKEQESKFSPTNRAIFPNIVSSLAKTSEQTNPMTEEAFKRARSLADTLKQSRLNQARAESQQALAPIPLGDSTGRQAITRQQYETQQAALSSQLQAETELAGFGQTQQQIQQAGLTGAGGLIPEALRYGVGSGGNDPQSQASQYAREVISGSRTYDDAVQGMGLYGNAGKQFLDALIRQGQPNFNFAQAQALSDIQGSVSPQLTMAQGALQNLQNTFANTPEWQKTSVPVLNSIANMFAAVGVGTGTATSKANAISEARTQVSNALGVMTNTTPTSWDRTVSQWFPDNATPEQVAAGIEQFNSLATNRQGVFGAPGQVQPFTPVQSATNSNFSW